MLVLVLVLALVLVLVLVLVQLKPETPKKETHTLTHTRHSQVGDYLMQVDRVDVMMMMMM